MNTVTLTRLAARCLGLTLIGSALLSTQVFASEPLDRAAITVKFGDLNLQSDVGVQMLYKRIRNAARLTCNVDGDQRNLKTFSSQSDCVAAAEARAVAHVNNDSLDAYYQAKIGRPSQLVAMNVGK